MRLTEGNEFLPQTSAFRNCSKDGSPVTIGFVWVRSVSFAWLKYEIEKNLFNSFAQSFVLRWRDVDVHEQCGATGVRFLGFGFRAHVVSTDVRAFEICVSAR